MQYKNKILTFRRDGSFDGMTDSYVAGDKSLITGKCLDYIRSGWHKSWYIVDKDNKEYRMSNTFETLIDVK